MLSDPRCSPWREGGPKMAVRKRPVSPGAVRRLAAEKTDAGGSAGWRRLVAPALLSASVAVTTRAATETGIAQGIGGRLNRTHRPECPHRSSPPARPLTSPPSSFAPASFFERPPEELARPLPRLCNPRPYELLAHLLGRVRAPQRRPERFPTGCRGAGRASRTVDRHE